MTDATAIRERGGMHLDERSVSFTKSLKRKKEDLETRKKTKKKKKRKRQKCFVGLGHGEPFFYPLHDICLTLRNIRGLGIERGRKRKRRRER